MKSLDTDAATYSLEHKMLDQGVQVLSENGQETLNTALKADLVVLNIAVSGKWLEVVLRENVPRVLPKVLWWIHEMCGHYFKLDYVKHLPLVAGAEVVVCITKSGEVLNYQAFKNDILGVEDLNFDVYFKFGLLEDLNFDVYLTLDFERLDYN
ncbi:hypothetical protein ACFX1T_008760 [Malus domestica]